MERFGGSVQNSVPEFMRLGEGKARVFIGWRNRVIDKDLLL
jgi:hypothetical protein